MKNIDQERFLSARASAEAEMQLEGGIGTLSEKIIHKTIKFYVDSCKENHEVEYLGSVADVKNGQGIFEIQTRHFSYLIPKLKKFLETDRVTVIYPIISEKTILWIDESGALSKPRKTSRTGRATDVLYEASALSAIIPHKNLTLRVMMIRAEEYRKLDGFDASRKRGATRVELLPTELLDVIDLCCERDYRELLPPLEEGFTAKDFSRALRLRGRRSSYSLTLLRRLGIVEQIGKSGNAFLYKINK